MRVRIGSLKRKTFSMIPHTIYKLIEKDLNLPEYGCTSAFINGYFETNRFKSTSL